jgi:hypothetical protein
MSPQFELVSPEQELERRRELGEFARATESKLPKLERVVRP